MGCHAQTPGQSPPATASAATTPATPQQTELNRRIQTIARTKFNLPPDVTVTVGARTKSTLVPGYDAITLVFSRGTQHSNPIPFLISTDGTTLARLETFELSGDTTAGRPMRGDPSAPLTIISFDDLECPFCSMMHTTLFPATLEHFKGLVRVVYKDFPLEEIHPWAMHAAVDANCLAAQSPAAYWNYVDYLHAHASDITGDKDKHDLAKSTAALDKLMQDEGAKQHVNADLLKACGDKQDQTAVRAFIKEGDVMGVEATPTMYLNGGKIDGAMTQEEFWRKIDAALLAMGITPPPEPPPPPAPAPKPATGAVPPAQKPPAK